PGGPNSGPRDFFLFKTKIYFVADDGNVGNELWVTDGTAAGTSLIKDIYAGAGGSLTYFSFRELNNAIYFSANDNINGEELWKSDGTTAGTTIVKDILPGIGSAKPSWLTLFNGQ